MFKKLLSGLGGKKPSDVAVPYDGLRRMALAITKEQVGVDSGSSEAVLGVVADWALDNGRHATVACFADGTTSLYTSSGGGIIGAGQREEVRKACGRVMAIAAASSKAMKPVTEHPLPPVGSMRFAVITTRGAYAGEGAVDELKSGRHPLSQLAGNVQAVITLLRENTPEKGLLGR